MELVNNWINWKPARFGGMWIMTEEDANEKIRQLILHAQSALEESRRLLEERKREKMNAAAAIF